MAVRRAFRYRFMSICLSSQRRMRPGQFSGNADTGRLPGSWPGMLPARSTATVPREGRRAESGIAETATTRCILPPAQK